MKKIVAGVAILATFAPLGVFAQGTTAQPARGAAVNFCTRIAELETRFAKNSTDREEKLGNKAEERDLRLSQKRDERTSKLAAHRTTWDGNRNAQYAKLMERASTTAQKAAVTTFQTTIEAAVTARRTAIDAANTVHRAGVDQAIRDRRDALAQPANALKNAMNAAMAKAKTDCAANVSPVAIRQAFMQSIKAAQDQFKIDVKAVDKVVSKLEVLNATRKTAVEKAIADFKAGAEQARTDLKTALQKP